MALSRAYEEKRDFMRMGVECRVSMEVVDSGERLVGQASNLSATGLLIACDRALPLGTMVEISLVAERSIVPPLDALAEVVRVVPAGESFHLGVKITEMRR